MSFNWSGALSGILAEGGKQAQVQAARIADLEEKQLEEKIWNRKQKAMLEREMTLKKYGYDLKEESTLAAEGRQEKRDIAKEGRDLETFEKKQGILAANRKEDTTAMKQNFSFLQEQFPEKTTEEIYAMMNGGSGKAVPGVSREQLFKEWKATNLDDFGNLKEGGIDWETYLQEKTGAVPAGEDGGGTHFNVQEILQTITPKEQESVLYHAKAALKLEDQSKIEQYVLNIDDERLRIAVAAEVEKQLEKTPNVKSLKKKTKLSDDLRLDEEKQKENERANQFMNTLSSGF